MSGASGPAVTHTLNFVAPWPMANAPSSPRPSAEAPNSTGDRDSSRSRGKMRVALGRHSSLEGYVDLLLHGLRLFFPMQRGPPKARLASARPCAGPLFDDLSFFAAEGAWRTRLHVQRGNLHRRNPQVGALRGSAVPSGPPRPPPLPEPPAQRVATPALQQCKYRRHFPASGCWSSRGSRTCTSRRCASAGAGCAEATAVVTRPKNRPSGASRQPSLLVAQARAAAGHRAALSAGGKRVFGPVGATSKVKFA